MLTICVCVQGTDCGAAINETNLVVVTTSNGTDSHEPIAAIGNVGNIQLEAAEEDEEPAQFHADNDLDHGENCGIQSWVCLLLLCTTFLFAESLLTRRTLI